MELVAHRAFAGHYPENTVFAAERAAERAPWIEIDLRRCADGVVAFHDATLDRLTGGAGDLAGASLAELRASRVLGTDQPVARFEDLLAAVPGDTGFVVDVKEPGIVPEALSTAADAPHDVRVLTGDDEVLAEAVASDAPAGYIGPDRDDLPALADRGVDYVYRNFADCARTDFVAAAREQGLDVNAGCIRTREEARLVPDLRDRGADLLTTDRWDYPELRPLWR